MTQYPALFSTFTLNGLEIPNRIVMAPMTRSHSPGGHPTQDVADYYRRRAEGGVGLIITEGTTIDHPSASMDDKIPDFHTPEALAGWKRVADEVHEAGGLIMPQLWHTGSMRREGTGLHQRRQPFHLRVLNIRARKWALLEQAGCFRHCRCFRQR